MDAKLYLKELKRLTNSCNVDCNDCRLYDKMSGEYHEDNESIGVDIVEKWAKDCPADTVLDVFKRNYPNHLNNFNNITPNCVCPDILNTKYSRHCAESRIWSCEECWNQPAIIEPQKEARKEPLIIESECHVCKYTCKSPDEWPCKVCSNAYTNEFRIREVE